MTTKKITAMASIQLAGEFGVYANGQMVQMLLPLETNLSTSECKATNVDPIIKTDPKKILSLQIKKRLEKSAGGKITKTYEWLTARNLCSKPSPPVIFKTDFPLSLGIEDNLRFLSFALLGTVTEPQKLATLMMQCEWDIGRKSCSYLYLLPAMARSLGVCKKDNVFFLKRPMPVFRSWGEFEYLMNRPKQVIDNDKWLSNMQPFCLPGVIQTTSKTSEGKSVPTNILLDIAVWGRSKVPLPHKLHASVSDSVISLPLPQERPLLDNLGSLTDMIGLVLADFCQEMQKGKHINQKQAQDYWERLGRLLTCYHFTMSAMQRTDIISDAFVAHLCHHLPQVLGAKTTASGLGGTVICAYSCTEETHKTTLKEMENIATQFGYRLLCDRVLWKTSHTNNTAQ